MSETIIPIKKVGGGGTWKLKEKKTGACSIDFPSSFKELMVLIIIQNYISQFTQAIFPKEVLDAVDWNKQNSKKIWENTNSNDLTAIAWNFENNSKINFTQSSYSGADWTSKTDVYLFYR